MSAADIPETETCVYCGGTFDLPNRRPNHCDDACYFRDKGDGVLNRLDADHTICSTCYRPVKEIEAIPPAKRVYAKGPDHPNRRDHGPKDISDGFQYATKHTDFGIDERTTDAGTDPDDPWARLEYRRWTCECGNVDPTDTHAVIQTIDLTQTRKDCFKALVVLYEKDAIPHVPDLSAYKRTLTEHPHDARLAIGRAVYGHA